MSKVRISTNMRQIFAKQNYRQQTKQAGFAPIKGQTEKKRHTK